MKCTVHEATSQVKNLVRQRCVGGFNSGVKWLMGCGNYGYLMTLGILIFKGLTARRPFKSFGVKCSTLRGATGNIMEYSFT
jgi:hypothetical protein